MSVGIVCLGRAEGFVWGQLDAILHARVFCGRECQLDEDLSATIFWQHVSVCLCVYTAGICRSIRACGRAIIFIVHHIQYFKQYLLYFL
jgi:hypothetical protein